MVKTATKAHAVSVVSKAQPVKTETMVKTVLKAHVASAV